MADRCSISRRTFLAASGTCAVGIGLGTAGCASAPAAVFNPAVDGWLAQIGIAVGATVISNLVSDGLKDAWRLWRPGVNKTIGKQASGSYGWHSASGWLHPVPPVAAFSTSTGRYANPMTDRLVACVDNGASAVVFQAWAWQSLFIFIHELTNGKAGDQLAQARDLCVLTLIPSGTRPDYGQSPRGTVGWMTYKSRNGAVEIARVSTSDGSNGIVTAYGMLDAGGKPTSRTFRLPA